MGLGTECWGEELERGMAFLGTVEKKNPLQQQQSSNPPPSLLPEEEG